MNYYQGLSNQSQPINPNQLNQAYPVFYSEPVIHEPIIYSYQTNNYGGYRNAYPVANTPYPNYSHYSSSTNHLERTTLNPNMFQPIISKTQQPLDMQFINTSEHLVKPNNQPINEQTILLNQGNYGDQINPINQINFENQPKFTNQLNNNHQANLANQPNDEILLQNQQQMKAMYPNHPYLSQVANTQTHHSNTVPTNPVDAYFINPLQNQSNVNHPMYNPYPKMKIMPKQQSTSDSILSSFKTPDGKYDIPTVVNTAGQMVSVVNQVGSIFKGIGGIFKV